MNAEARNAQLPVGPLLAAAGAVLLIVSLFLDWYEGFTGYTTFEFIDLLLTALALVVIGALAAGLGLLRMEAPSGVTLGVGVLAVLVVLSQVINDPPLVIGPGRDQDIGIWLGLAGSALMVAGGVLGYAHISLAVETRSRAAPPRPAPPSTPPPAGREEPTERL
jgi:hypothetical protein